MSAYILTGLPAILAIILVIFMPDYYGGVMDKDLTWKLIGIALGLLALGNYIMAKMSNIKV
jgi:Flp pilus assembly protein TadB